MKKILLTIAVLVTMFASALAALAGSCMVFAPNPCGPNNPVTQRIHVAYYTVAKILPCNDRNGTKWFIVASNGRQWHDKHHVWDWSRIHIGSHFRVVGAKMDSDVLHGDVAWN